MACAVAPSVWLLHVVKARETFGEVDVLCPAVHHRAPLAVIAHRLGLRRRLFVLDCVRLGGTFPTPLDEDVSLQRVLSREALVAMIAREWLDCQVDPLMPLQIVIAVETLRALIAFEWAIIGRLLLGMGVSAVHLLHARCLSTIEAGHHPSVHVANE